MKNTNQTDDIMLMYEFMEKSVKDSPEYSNVYDDYIAGTESASSLEEWVQAVDRVRQHPSFNRSEYLQLLASQALINASANALEFEKARDMADTILNFPLFNQSPFLQREYATALSNAAIFYRNREDGENILNRFRQIPGFGESTSVQYFYASALNSFLCTCESFDEKKRYLNMIREIPDFDESHEIKKCYAESLKNLSYNTGMEISISQGKKIADEITEISGFKDSEELKEIYARAILGLMEEMVEINSQSEPNKTKQSSQPVAQASLPVDNNEILPGKNRNLADLKAEFLKAITEIPGYEQSEMIQYEYAMSLTGSVKSHHTSGDVLELSRKIDALPLFETSEPLNIEYLRSLMLYGYALQFEKNNDQKEWDKIFHAFDSAMDSPTISIYTKCDIVGMWLSFHKELKRSFDDTPPNFLTFNRFLDRLEKWIIKTKETQTQEDLGMFVESVKYFAGELEEGEKNKIIDMTDT